MTIFDIDERILECVDQETGEILDEEALAALTMERDEKIEGVLLWIKELSARTDAIAKEIQNLTARKRSAEALETRLRGWAAYALDGQKFETTRCKASWRRSQAVVVDDVEALPPQFVRVTTSPDKTAIKDALKDGIVINGAHMEERQNLIIK